MEAGTNEAVPEPVSLLFEAEEGGTSSRAVSEGSGPGPK